MSFLEIRDLTYTYPNSGVRAVDGLSLDADRGEIIAVIGPNAAGKSTFALILKGLLRPESGSITINNIVRSSFLPDPGIGILFSNPENQLVTSIVEEDVAFGLEVRGEPSQTIEQKVEAILGRLGILHLRKRMPHLMSGGEQQMAALAGVLILDPDILVLDEPTTYLDPDARASVLAAMRDLARQGKIVILITHDMKEAAFADRMVLFTGGRIAADGIPEDIFHQPGLVKRYGLYPPFLLSILLELRSSGLEVNWPCGPEVLAGIIADIVGDRPGHDVSAVTRASQSGRDRPVIIFDHVSFGYGFGAPGEKPVLSEVDFAIEKGTMSLICGANGSGKSTLLQMSNGLIKPDSGQILFHGRQLGALRKVKGGIPGKVALLFQNPERQLFSSTVYDDIAFGPRNMGLDEHEVKERVMKALRWTGLSVSVLDRAVFTLSGGQMRRAAVAGSLAMEPEVLVLDEPTDGLDPESKREFYKSARQYCDETGTTVVMAAHAVPEQISVIDHFGHLADGQMQSTGSPVSVLTGPASTLPRQFLPDHLIFMEELMERGVGLPEGVLDPEIVRKQVLVLADAASRGDGT